MRWLPLLALGLVACSSAPESPAPLADADPITADSADSSPVLADANASDAGSDVHVDAPIDAGPPGVRLVGRFDVTNPDAPRFAWSGSAMHARFNGTSVRIKLEGAANQFAVVIDGKAPSVLETTSSTTTYTLATALPPGVHEVLVHRRTEASFGEVRFLGFELDGGSLLPPPPAPARRIEVIGDSITCGYGNEGKDQYCNFTADTENHYLTYAAIAARTLGADLHAIGWSGIGMYRNYDGGTSGTMPQRWGRTLPNLAASTWDTSRFQPHAVVINLGTNDFAKGDPGAAFTNAYVAFVRKVRAAYPNAWIFPSVGSMLSGTSLTRARGYLQSVVTTFESEGDKKLAVIEFATQTAADGYGCDWHPNLATNAKMAKVLETALRDKLGW